MRSLHVAVAQVNSKACDPQGNLAKHRRQVESAAAVGVEALLFAETSLHAYDMSEENKANAEKLGGPLTSKLSAWADEFKMAIMAGFLERDGDKLYNCHAIAMPGGRLLSQRKHALTDKEKNNGVSQGAMERITFELNSIRCAIIICADTGIVNLDDHLGKLGVDYRFIPTAGGGTLDSMMHESDFSTPEGRKAYTERRPQVFKPEAIIPDKNVPIGFASANALGFDGRNCCHQGHCMIVDNNGVMRVQIPGTCVVEHQQDQMGHAILSFA